jgi:transcriptional regulator with XRE-family HTH domain
LSDVLARFGDRLRDVRQAAGVSQERLAELAGLHRTYVSSVERGLRNISLLNIEKLADALGVSLADLMPGKPKGKAQGPVPRSRPDRS